MTMFIYEYHDWPHFIYDSHKISELLENCHVTQGRLLSKMELLGLSQREDKILENISSDVIKSSEIEGFLLNKEQVRSSIAHRLGLQKQMTARIDRNVDAVVEMMLDATQNYEKPLTKDRLFSWHACLFPTGYSGMNKIEVAQYRTSGMQVVSGGMGMEKIHYEAPPASKVPEEMETFLAWLNDESKNDDSLINSAVAHLWFVTLHPFEDGNGRIARTISDMMLCRSDHTNLRFYSMSNQISLDKKAYYDILEQTQHGSPDITEWLIWFLTCLKKALDLSLAETENVFKKYSFFQNLGAIQLNSRQRLMLEKLTDGTWFGVLNSSKWAKITKCSNDTALRDITDLIEKGLIEKEATSGGRSTNYLLSERFTSS